MLIDKFVSFLIVIASIFVIIVVIKQNKIKNNNIKNITQKKIMLKSRIELTRNK
jgi:hypothetical protein